MEQLTNFIYKRIIAVNPLAALLPADDVKQEIRIAIWQEQAGKEIRGAAKNITRLAKELGYSRKKGKDNFQPFYEQSSMDEEQTSLLHYVEELYSEHTCKEVCAILQVPYSKRLQKLFHNAFPKNAGWGGKRKNSGNKKKNETSSKTAV